MDNDKTNTILSFLKQHRMLRMIDDVSLDRGIYSRNLMTGDVVMYHKHEYNHYILNLFDLNASGYLRLRPLALNEDEVIKLLANSVIITSEDIENDNLWKI